MGHLPDFNKKWVQILFLFKIDFSVPNKFLLLKKRWRVPIIARYISMEVFFDWGWKYLKEKDLTQPEFNTRSGTCFGKKFKKRTLCRVTVTSQKITGKDRVEKYFEFSVNKCLPSNQCADENDLTYQAKNSKNRFITIDCDDDKTKQSNQTSCGNLNPVFKVLHQ